MTVINVRSQQAGHFYIIEVALQVSLEVRLQYYTKMTRIALDNCLTAVGDGYIDYEWSLIN